MQGMDQWRRSVLEFLQEQSGPVFLLAALFLVGVLFGSLAVKSLGSRDKLELVAYVSGGVQVLAGSPAESGAALLRDSLLGKVRLLGLVWLMTISLVGVLGVMLFTFLRGLVTGFVVTFLTAEMGGQGMLLALVGHIPQSLIEVPALLLLGTASVVFVRQVIRSWRDLGRVQQFYSALTGFTVMLFKAGLLLALAAVAESYLTPLLIRLAAGWANLA